MTVLANCALALMLLQYLPARRVPGQPPVPGANTAAVATFTGQFKSADKKFLTIMVGEGQTIRMYITGATKFFRDGMPAKAADFHTDENVTVDASRDAGQNLLAVRVATVAAAPSSPGRK